MSLNEFTTKKEFATKLAELNDKGIYLENITRHLDQKMLKIIGLKQVWVDEDGMRKGLPLNMNLPYSEKYIKVWGESCIFGDAYCLRK